MANDKTKLTFFSKKGHYSRGTGLRKSVKNMSKFYSPGDPDDSIISKFRNNFSKNWNATAHFFVLKNNNSFDFQHLKRSFKPTDLWYENEHRELMLVDANKDSPILAFRRGGAYANRSSTEV